MNKDRVKEAAKILGLKVLWNTPIKKGDLYIACRNTITILECKELRDQGRIIVPIGIEYWFNSNDCVKVIEK